MFPSVKLIMVSQLFLESHGCVRGCVVDPITSRGCMKVKTTFPVI